MVPNPKDDSAGKSLMRFDPDYAKGRGRAWWTPNIDPAQEFDSMGELAAEWRRASTVVPIRPDGRPNRAARTKAARNPLSRVGLTA